MSQLCAKVSKTSCNVNAKKNDERYILTFRLVFGEASCGFDIYFLSFQFHLSLSRNAYS